VYLFVSAYFVTVSFHRDSQSFFTEIHKESFLYFMNACVTFVTFENLCDKIYIETKTVKNEKKLSKMTASIIIKKLF
jgi:hypothetical protein